MFKIILTFIVLNFFKIIIFIFLIYKLLIKFILYFYFIIFNFNLMIISYLEKYYLYNESPTKIKDNQIQFNNLKIKIFF